ncbi:MAG: DNA-binding protein WhiA [Lachnospiraceae bacterium]
MSFSADVKDEVSRVISTARHCRIAELAAIFSMCGSVMISANDNYAIKITTENVLVARKFYKLVKMVFEVNAEITIKPSKKLNKGNIYTIIIRKNDSAVKILKAFRILDENMNIQGNVVTGNLLTQQACCKRAFIRGAFMASGSISDPARFYHFEIVCDCEEKAVQLRDMINSFDLNAKVVMRKKNYVVYIKEGTQIVEALNIIEAHVSMMDLENVRILHEVRNTVNRRVNCETANLKKTVTTARKQIKDIEYIRDTIGLSSLKEGLEEVARARLENPDMPLKDLGLLLSEPVGKSGVNHRLKKISEIAESLRDNKEE